MSEAYANELENWFNSFPSIIQDAVRPIFDKMNEALRWVAGDPQDLVRAGQAYVDIGGRLQTLIDEQVADRGQLSGRWAGDAFDAFSRKMSEIEGKLGKLADATTKTNEILEAAAKAAVDGANMIIDIIVMVLSLMLAELAINAALSVLTFGASLAAMVAEWIAQGVAAAARVLKVVGKVAEVLQKLVQLLEKLAQLFRMLKSFFAGLKELLAVLKEIKDGASGMAKLGWFSAHSGGKWAASKVIQGATGGNVVIPGVAGEGYHAGKDYVGAWGDASDAVEAAK